jgi:hypothetical protein
MASPVKGAHREHSGFSGSGGNDCNESSSDPPRGDTARFCHCGCRRLPPAAPNTYRGSANVPFASARRLPGLAARRPRNSSVPPDGQSKRQAGPGRTGHRCWVGGPRSSQLGNSSAGGPPAGSLHSYSSWSGIPRTPCRRPIKPNEVGNKDTREPRGIVVPVVGYFRSSLGGVRPWRASVRRRARRHGPGASQRLGGLRDGGRRQAGNRGTSTCNRRHKSSAASYTGSRVTAIHKSRALPPAPQRKQCQQCHSR